MFVDLHKFSIYIKPGRTDMSKQTNRLSIIAEEVMELDLQSRNIFLFCSRDRMLIKCLYWDRNEFCLWLVGAKPLLAHASWDKRGLKKINLPGRKVKKQQKRLAINS